MKSLEKQFNQSHTFIKIYIREKFTKVLAKIFSLWKKISNKNKYLKYSLSIIKVHRMLYHFIIWGI